MIFTSWLKIERDISQIKFALFHRTSSYHNSKIEGERRIYPQEG